MNLSHILAIIQAALPVIVIILGAVLAAAKVINPAVAAKNPHLGAVVSFWDTIVDTLYDMLTSKAGLAEDVTTLAQSNALKGLVTQLHTITAEPIVAIAIQAAITKLPSADQDAVKAIIAPLPVPLTFTAVSNAPAKSP